MGLERKFITKLHNSTKRDYLVRMNDSKVKCMSVAKKYGKDYWDGNRRYGYGGYKYIPGRWKDVAKKIIKVILNVSATVNSNFIKDLSNVC